MFHRDAKGDNGFIYCIRQLANSHALFNFQSNVIERTLKSSSMAEICPPRLDGKTIVHLFAKYTSRARLKHRYLRHFLRKEVAWDLFKVDIHQLDAKVNRLR